MGPRPSRPGDLLTPSRRRKARRDLWRVRGHLVSNRDFAGPKFFNSINSLCRIGRADDALRQAREWRQQCRGIAEKNPLFQRLQFRNGDGAARHRNARGSVRAWDRNLFRPAARPVENAPAPRGRSRKRRIDVAHLVGWFVIGSVISGPAVVGGKAPAEIPEKAPVVVMREFVETVQGPAAIGWKAGWKETPDLPACASRGRVDRRGIAVANSRAVLKRLNMTQLLCASPCLLFRSAPPCWPYRPSLRAIE